MKLSEIEGVKLVSVWADGLPYALEPVDKLHTPEQMQEFMVENVRHALTLYGAKVCGFHLEQLEKAEIEKIIQDLFTEDTKND